MRNDEEKPQDRSVGDILENNEKLYNEIKSGTDGACDYITPSSPNMKGGGTNDQIVPLWTTDDLNTLPEFNRATNIRKKYDTLKEILSSEGISPFLKKKLYTFFRDKYDVERGIPGSRFFMDDDDENEFTDYETKKGALMTVVENIKAPYKRHLANSIGKVMLNNNNHVAWDKYGNFTLPSKIEDMNLNLLLEIITTKKKGSSYQIKIIKQIIKPFFNKIDSFIRNEKILKKSSGWKKGKMESIKYII